METPTYDIINPGPGFGHRYKCGGAKLLNGIPNFFKIMSDVAQDN